MLGYLEEKYPDQESLDWFALSALGVDRRIIRNDDGTGSEFAWTHVDVVDALIEREKAANSDEAQSQLAQEAADLLQLVREEFLTPGSVKVVAFLIFGSDTKIVEDDDGKQVEVPYSHDDILQHLEVMEHQGEIGTRRHLARDMMLALESVDQAASEMAGEDLIRFNLIRDISFVLLERVLSSEVDVSDPSPVSFPGVIFEAELVEVIRREVLDPSYAVIPGIGESISSVPSFCDLGWAEKISEQIQGIEEEYGDLELEKFRQKQLERVLKNLDTRTPEEWINISKEVERHILIWLKGRVHRNEWLIEKSLRERIYGLGSLQELSILIQEFGGINEFMDKVNI